MHAVNAQPAQEASKTEVALRHVDRAISDLIDEITAVQGFLGPLLTPEDESQEKAGVSPTAESNANSPLVREIFNIAERIQYQTIRLNAIKNRVEL